MSSPIRRFLLFWSVGFLQSVVLCPCLPLLKHLKHELELYHGGWWARQDFWGRTGWLFSSLITSILFCCFSIASAPWHASKTIHNEWRLGTSYRDCLNSPNTVPSFTLLSQINHFGLLIDRTPHNHQLILYLASVNGGAEIRFEYSRRKEVPFHHLLLLFPQWSCACPVILMTPQLFPPYRCSTLEFDGSRFQIDTIWDLLILKNMFHFIQPINKSFSL